ncbi:MAG: ETC complex I subunit [Aquisalinus sp.]|nr:ETC complex I subunit [Aquisalinus sp.]MCI5048633.1 ETC complex I subunit [Aquisalinus sp.]
MFARIYSPAKTAMQSGKNKTRQWILEFDQAAAKRIDPLMGWTSSSDTVSNQVRLKFDTREAAISYAKEKNIPYRIDEKAVAEPVIKSYSDNFAVNRRKPWTH